MSKILVVEDEKATADAICDLLAFEKHIVEHAPDGADAWERLQNWQYDLVVLDWSLPEMNGIEVLTKFRQGGGKTPVLFLTGRNTTDNKIEGLDSGADDYLSKPFDVRELQARVRALLRRSPELSDNEIEIADLKINVDQRTCVRGDEVIKLLPKEFDLLKFFMTNQSRVFSVEEILDRLWSSESDSGPDAVRQTVKRLRAKIDVEAKPSLIVTVFGVGYKMEVSENT
jgi:OmpR-family two-component system manganese-sensing response regulator